MHQFWLEREPSVLSVSPLCLCGAISSIVLGLVIRQWRREQP